MLQNQEKNNVLKSCFIITPIGEPNSDIQLKAFGLIKAVIKPVLESFKYEPISAADISSSGSINRQIIIKLYEDDLVIANLTGLNPNVMYELAVRHAVKKPVIIMAERGTKLPFDLIDQRCIFYEDTLHGVEIAKEQLDSFLKTALSDVLINNPIYDSLKENQIIRDVDQSDNDLSKYLLGKFARIENLLSEVIYRDRNYNYNNKIDRKLPKRMLIISNKSESGQLLLDSIRDYMSISGLIDYTVSFDIAANGNEVLIEVLDSPQLQKSIIELKENGYIVSLLS